MIAPGRRVAVALSALAVAGCISLPSRTARLNPCCSASGRWTLDVQVPTGSLKAGGTAVAIYREQRWFSISLASRPTPESHRYGIDRIEVQESDPGQHGRIVVSEGYVDVDPKTRRADIELTTPEGAFWGNGTYPLE